MHFQVISGIAQNTEQGCNYEFNPALVNLHIESARVCTIFEKA